MPANEAAKGLRLNLPGAPSTPHTIPGIAGWYRPDRPTPVGGPGELPLKVAEKAHADPAIPLVLEDIPAKELPRLRDEAKAQREAARSGVASAARAGDHVKGRGDAVVEADAKRVHDEAAALAATGKES